MLLDGAKAARAVGSGPGEDDTHRPLPPILGERAKERIHGHRWPGLVGWGDPQAPALEGQPGVRRYDVDVVGYDCDAVLRRLDRHARMAAQQLWQHARVVAVEMLHDDEGHAAVGWQAREEAGERLQPTRRGTQPDDHSWRRAVERYLPS